MSHAPQSERSLAPLTQRSPRCALVHGEHAEQPARPFEQARRPSWWTADEGPLNVAFISYHASFDPSNGAARSMRDLLHLLRCAGCTTSSLTGPCIDGRGRGHDVVLRAIVNEGLPLEENVDPASSALFASNDRGTPNLLYLPEITSSAEPSDVHREAFLRIAEDLLRATRPDVVLTYGGGVVGRAIVAAAKAAGAAVAFRVSSFRYTKRDLFVDADGVLVPAHHVAALYAKRLGLDCMPIASPLDWERTLVGSAANAAGKTALTYVAPTLEKGLPWAARILEELTARRPDIPILVVEGRGSLVDLAKRLSPAARAHITMARTTQDPRLFLEKTRVLLMPSYREPSGRLAQEAIVNDIPVVASDRDGLVETLSEAGIRLDIPAPYDEHHAAMPSREEVSTWLATIERLWDDSAFYARESARCAKAKVRWAPERLTPEYVRYLLELRRPTPSRRERGASLAEGGDGAPVMPALERARATSLRPSSPMAFNRLKTAPLTELHIPE